MPRISKEKKDKIKEQILFFLYSIFPKQVFTAEIARETARDEEFTKQLLIELYKKQIIIKVNKNPLGKTYLKRVRWRLSNKAHQAYKNQSNILDYN
jgi:hypothetical protein